MKEKKSGRTRIVAFRLMPGEYTRLETTCKKTTIRHLSECLRRLIFNKPVTRYVRNQSLDEFMAEMVLLRKELNAIGLNFNQAVRRLHTLDHVSQMQFWLKGFEQDKDVLFCKVEEIKNRINLISDQWLQ
ncbi:MAG: plasmid mobilization relaxosome protein MobC [Mucilaginibacter sp.]|nr:plasmid mobilization relaxosome protein MobC [Mucilaginibacter sp.]